MVLLILFYNYKAQRCGQLATIKRIIFSFVENEMTHIVHVNESKVHLYIITSSPSVLRMISTPCTCILVSCTLGNCATLTHLQFEETGKQWQPEFLCVLHGGQEFKISLKSAWKYHKSQAEGDPLLKTSGNKMVLYFVAILLLSNSLMRSFSDQLTVKPSFELCMYNVYIYMYCKLKK